MGPANVTNPILPRSYCMLVYGMYIHMYLYSQPTKTKKKVSYCYVIGLLFSGGAKDDEMAIDYSESTHASRTI